MPRYNPHTAAIKSTIHTYFVKYVIDIDSSFGRGLHEKESIFLSIYTCLLQHQLGESQ
jgi:hypothetical protein